MSGRVIYEIRWYGWVYFLWILLIPILYNYQQLLCVADSGNFYDLQNCYSTAWKNIVSSWAKYHTNIHAMNKINICFSSWYIQSWNPNEIYWKNKKNMFTTFCANDIFDFIFLENINYNWFYFLVSSSWNVCVYVYVLCAIYYTHTHTHTHISGEVTRRYVYVLCAIYCRLCTNHKYYQLSTDINMFWKNTIK